MPPIVLSDDHVDYISELNIRRHRIPEAPPWSEFRGDYYLWIDGEDDWRKSIFERICRRALYTSSTWSQSKKGKLYLRFSESDAHLIEREWQRFPKIVVIEDYLNLSIAMDFNYAMDGNNLERTEIGELVYQAKYRDSDEALKELCNVASSVAPKVFSSITDVCPIPSSRVSGGNKVPSRVAEAVAQSLGAKYRPDLLSPLVNRPSLKTLPKKEKIQKLQGTAETTSEGVGIFSSILLVDDNYQSGITVNYFAQGLRCQQPMGMLSVYGFSCDKTLRNSDNVSGSPGSPTRPRR